LNKKSLEKEEIDLIKKRLFKEGFKHVSFSTYFEVENEFKKFYLQFLKEKKEASLSYLQNIKAKFNIKEIYANTNTIIAASFFYHNQKVKLALKENPYKIASYAWGKDYHNVLKKRMKRVVKDISAGRIVTDSTPLPERYLGRKLNIGFIGKNGMLINPENGSYFLLVFALLERPLSSDLILENKKANIEEDFKKYCNNCSRCIKSCPGGAINSDGIINIENCISYQTIEMRGKVNCSNIKKNKWIFGCDVCQMVCPYNKKEYLNNDTDFYPSDISLDVSKGHLENIKDTHLFGTALKRAGIEGLRRNIKSKIILK